MKNNKAVFPQLKAIIITGFIAITVNIILLKAAPLFGIKAESGGLLKLVISYLPAQVIQMGFIHGMFFWVIFHYIIGYTMVLLYTSVFRQWLPGSGVIKGMLFSILPWLLNSFIILPLLNQGVIGIAVIPISGIIYFFVSNLVFGLLLGGLYEWLRTNHSCYLP